MTCIAGRAAPPFETDSHTDVTLWHVLQGHETTPVTADPGEISKVRWVRLADAADWALQCHAPHQVLRFATKVAALRTSAGPSRGVSCDLPVEADTTRTVGTETGVADKARARPQTSSVGRGGG